MEVFVRATEHQMPCTNPYRIGGFTALAAFSALVAFGGVNSAVAQEPPQAVPAGGLPPALGAIPFNGWLLFPSLDFFSRYSNNYFLSPQSKIAGWSFGVSPSLTAEWSNGIHTTTLFGSFTNTDYPTSNEVNSNDEEGTFTQKYAPLRDLTFTFLGDYTHQTIASSLTSSIPTSISTPATSLLPNGNTVLPNGTIVSPSGQFIGQTNTPLSVNGLSVVNPFDQYTSSAKVEKIFGDGIVTLSDSLRRTDYEQQASESFTANTFTEDVSFWLGPVFYGYSSGSYTTYSDTITPGTVYRIIGGIGTRQFGLFRASTYFGYQASELSGFAGGNVFGGTLTYYPTRDLTIKASVDETINISSQTAASNLAISIPISSPLQIPLSASTQITASTLHSDYIISTQWTAGATFGYTRVQYLGSPLFANAWLADATLKYDIWRDLTLAWEYQYSSIDSNQPQTTANRNLVSMSASYKF